MSIHGQGRGGGKGKGESRAIDPVAVTLEAMADGEWKLLSDLSTQPGGPHDVAPDLDLATWAINHGGNDWRDDWANVSPGSGTPPATDADVAATVVSPRSILRAWCSSVVVDKGNEHCQLYIPGGGGHNNYGGNECYSFDIHAACASLNAGGDGGIWVRRNDPARLAHSRDGSGSILRDYNPNYPYTSIQEDNVSLRFSPYDPDDPFGTDQRHVGPISGHHYGGLWYDEELDAIVVYAGAAFRIGTSTQGFWLWSIANQRWELLPADHALGAGAQAVNGAFSLKDAAASAVNHTLIKLDTLKYWFGRNVNSFRVKLDGTTYSTNALSSPNEMAQRTGTYLGVPGGHNYNITSGPGCYAIAAPFDTASPPGASTSNLAAWIFVNDDSAGGGGGWALIWPNIAIDDDDTDNTYLDYANDMPNSGGEILPDVASGVYSAAHDAFFFPHKSWLADFDGQIYAFDRATLIWSTYISGGLGDAPAQSLDEGEQGARGHFAYLPDRNCFSFVYDSDESAGGKVLLCKIPSSVQYVDAIIMHGTPGAGNEFNTFTDARLYLRSHADIVAGTHRGRITYEYSTTAYDNTQVPAIYTTSGDHWPLHCIGETGGPSTAINDSYDGDVAENQTDTFDWSVPGGATSPLGMGDLTVTRNGVALKPIRDYEFRYDSYDYANNGYPSTSGSITLIAWSGSSPAAPVSNPLGAGETLTITSVEARPILAPDTGLPVRLQGQRYNPEYQIPPILADYYGIEDLVITQVQSGSTHVGSVTFNCQRWRIKGCFLFGLQQGIGDAHPQAAAAPMVRGQYEIINTTIFDCGANSDLIHNAYLGRAANIILDNVVSTDVAIDASSPGRSMKVKPTDKLFIRNCVFAERPISDWMGFTTADGPDVLSILSETTTSVVEDTIFSKSSLGTGFFMTCTSRKSPWNEAIGSHGPGPQRPVYTMANVASASPSPRTEQDIPGSYLDVEWNYDVAAGTTEFAWTHVSDWDAWSPTSNDDLIVGVCEGTDGHDMVLIPSTGFSATNLDGASSSGIVDLSGGSSPSYPSGVPDGAVVFVSPHYKTDLTDYWTDEFWENIKICGVFVGGFASGTTASVAWSVSAPNQGGVDDPDDADFHVSVNGATLVLDTDYTVSGGGTSSGTIDFSPSLSDGDFYMITSDAHKTQGVTPVLTDDVHTWYYNTYFNPGSPVSPWSVGESYRWPTVKRLFLRNNTFLHTQSPSSQRGVVTTGTRPLASHISDAERLHPVPDGWRERFMSFAAANTRWNVPTMFDPTNTSYYGTNVVSPQYHLPDSDTYQGSAPSNPVTDDLLPDWWVTFDDAPTRIEV